MLYCTKCGHQVHETAPACPQCGAAQKAVTVRENASKKSRLVTFLLCLFLGGLGIHRFYVGKTGTGIVWMLTLGVLGFGALIDFITIAAGSFTDDDGRRVLEWEPQD